MLFKKALLGGLFSAILFATLAGCVQYPTERQAVIDLRPQISFRFDSANSQINDARVLVNGLDSGRLGDFIEGKGSLRVLPGMNTVRVVNGTEVLLDERAYLGDGITRPFNVK
jgi:hypothetical protein